MNMCDTLVMFSFLTRNYTRDCLIQDMSFASPSGVTCPTSARLLHLRPSAIRTPPAIPVLFAQKGGKARQGLMAGTIYCYILYVYINEHIYIYIHIYTHIDFNEVIQCF